MSHANQRLEDWLRREIARATTATSKPTSKRTPALRTQKTGRKSGDPPPSSPPLLAVPVPIRIRSVNERSWYMSWHAGWRLRRAQRRMVVNALKAYELPELGDGLEVTLVRIGPGVLDGDNLQSGFKAVRDQVADWLGVDDGAGVVRWRYAQKRGDYAVRIEIRRLEGSQTLRDASSQGVVDHA